MEITIPEFELEVICPRCYGHGQKRELGPLREVCSNCDGEGYIITTDGHKVLDFLKKYYKPVLEVK